MFERSIRKAIYLVTKPIPALLNKTSTEPVFSKAKWINDFTAFGSDTSAIKVFMPLSSNSDNLSIWTSQAKTIAPSLWKFSAQALPIPFAAPVMRIVLSLMIIPPVFFYAILRNILLLSLVFAERSHDLHFQELLTPRLVSD